MNTTNNKFLPSWGRRGMSVGCDDCRFIGTKEFLLGGFLCLLFLALPLSAQQPQELRLTLDETITLARRQSVNAAVALNELKTAYWEYRSYKADLLPEMSLSGTIPAYNKRYNTYQREDGGYSYVRNDYMQMDGSLSIKQNIWLTGGAALLQGHIVLQWHLN